MQAENESEKHAAGKLVRDEKRVWLERLMLGPNSEQMLILECPICGDIVSFSGDGCHSCGFSC